MKQIWTITCLSKCLNEDTEHTYLEKLTDTEGEAKALLDRVYIEASEGFVSRQTGAKHYDPRWLDEEHTILQVSVSMTAGYGTLNYTHTYEIGYVWQKNLDKPWILE